MLMPLLHAFRESKPAFGAWITIPSPWVARTAAQASPHLSWLVIDCEHGLIPLQPGAADTIAAVSGIGTTTPSLLVRIPATGACAETSCAWQIKYVLDAGARGVIVPMVRPDDPRCGLRTHIIASYFTRLIVHLGIYATAGTRNRVCSQVPTDRHARIWQPVYTDCMGHLDDGLLEKRQRRSRGHGSN